METCLMGERDKQVPFHDGQDNVEGTPGRQQADDFADETLMIQCGGMAGLSAACAGWHKAIVEKGWVGDDELVGFGGLKLLYGGVVYVYARCPGSLCGVVAGLGGIGGFELYGIDPCHGLMCGALCEHEGDHAGAGTDVEQGLCVVDVHPGAQQHGVGAHLHGAAVMAYGKLLKMEMCSAPGVQNSRFKVQNCELNIRKSNSGT
jgi:hypothetical protein